MLVPFWGIVRRPCSLLLHGIFYDHADRSQEAAHHALEGQDKCQAVSRSVIKEGLDYTVTGVLTDHDARLPIHLLFLSKPEKYGPNVGRLIQSQGRLVHRCGHRGC